MRKLLLLTQFAPFVDNPEEELKKLEEEEELDLEQQQEIFEARGKST